MIPFEEILAKARNLASKHARQSAAQASEAQAAAQAFFIPEDISSSSPASSTYETASENEDSHLSGGAITRNQAKRKAAAEDEKTKLRREATPEAPLEAEVSDTLESENVSRASSVSPRTDSPKVDKVPGTTLFLKPEIVAENESFRVKVAKQGFKRFSNFYDSARFLLRVEYKDSETPRPLMSDLYGLLEDALIAVIKKVQNEFSVPTEEHQVYLNLTGSNIPKGIRSSNFSIRSSPQMMANQIIGDLMSFVDSNEGKCTAFLPAAAGL
jgi:hypothetical protein